MADHTHTHAHHHDGRAAFTGLIVGGLLVGGILFGVVKLTNAQYAGHAKGGAEATHTK
jgi:uncharacterized protein (DUF983 family)